MPNQRIWIVATVVACTLSLSSEAQEPPKLPAKLDTIIIPKVLLEKATVAESVDWLQRQIKDLDPDKTGVPIKLTGAIDEVSRVNLNTDNISAEALIKMLARHFDRQVQLNGHMVVSRRTSAS